MCSHQLQESTLLEVSSLRNLLADYVARNGSELDGEGTPRLGLLPAADGSLFGARPSELRIPQLRRCAGKLSSHQPQESKQPLDCPGGNLGGMLDRPSDTDRQSQELQLVQRPQQRNGSEHLTRILSACDPIVKEGEGSIHPLVPLLPPQQAVRPQQCQPRQMEARALMRATTP